MLHSMYNTCNLHESKKTIEIKIMVFKVDLEIWLVTFDIDYKNLRQLCYPDTGRGFKINL